MTEFPKIIHQIWIQGSDKVPPKFENNINNIKTLNPDWQYIIWDDESIRDMMSETNKKWLNTYNRLKYLHQKADFARYVILYVYGGTYIDIDAETIKPLSPLADKYSDYDLLVSEVSTNFIENYIATWQTQKLINNGVIMAKPGITILRKLVNSIVNEPYCEDYDTKYTCIQRITGPKKFSSIIHGNMNPKIKILSYDYFEPCILTHCNITPNTHIVHKHEGSWYSDNLKTLFNLYMSLKNNAILIALILLVLYFWFTRK